MTSLRTGNVYVKRKMRMTRPVLAGMALVVGVSAGGCVNLAKNNYFLPGGVDQTSPVAAQVGAASRAPGAFPTFSQIPPLPTDTRSLSEWRATVNDVKAQKQQVDAEVREHPFTLNNTATFAAEARARIPAAESVPPSADSSKVSDDYAAKMRGRATTPPPAN